MKYPFKNFDSDDIDDYSLPPEAMTFNGVTIEKVIPEYQTLQVTGRELMGQTLDTLKVGQQDGERIQGHSIPPREITVKYQINADSPERFRAIFYELNQILSGVDNKFYFADDPEKYFVGTLKEASVPDGGKLQVVSDFTILCNDPYAYSVREDEFTFNDQAETVNVIANLNGKNVGDTGNPNIAFTALTADSAVTPSKLTQELTQAQYQALYSKGGAMATFTKGNPNTGVMIKFNVIQSVEHSNPGIWSKYGLTTTADRINFLTTNMSKLTVNINGFGTPDMSYQVWNGTEWVGLQTKTDQKVVTITDTFATADEAMTYIDDGGFLYVMAYSTGTLHLDYTELTYMLATPVADTVTITNDGPLPVPVRFELTNKGQNGFLGLSTKDKAILIGDQTQMDGSTVAQSERIFTTDQDASKGLAQWELNKGIVNDMYVPNYVIGGNLVAHMNNYNFDRWTIRCNDYGKADNAWHGPTAHADFLPDSAGGVGAINFEARAYARFWAGNMSHYGIMDFVINNPGMHHLVSVRLWKWGGNHANLDIRIGDHWVYQDWGNQRWDQFFGSIVMRRFGNTFTIVLDSSESHGASQTITYTIDDDDDLSATDTANENAKASGFTVWEGTFGNTYPKPGSCDLTFFDFWITKHNVDKYTDVPNTFADGDLVTVTGDNGKVVTTVNGDKRLSLQDIGSEPLLAYPGVNNINVGYSSFANRPDLKAYIRKRYL